MSTNVDRSLYRRSTFPKPPARRSWQRRRAVAGQSQTALEKSTELIWLGLWVLEGLFALRFALKVMAANPENPFARLVYGFTDLFLRPFEGLVATPAASGMVLEISTLVAMAVYALAAWVVVRVIWVVFDRPIETDESIQVEVEHESGASSVPDDALVDSANWRRDF